MSPERETQDRIWRRDVAIATESVSIDVGGDPVEALDAPLGELRS